MWHNQANDFCIREMNDPSSGGQKSAAPEPKLRVQDGEKRCSLSSSEKSLCSLFYDRVLILAVNTNIFIEALDLIK